MYRKELNKENNTGKEDILFDYFRDNLESFELPVSDRCRENTFRQISNGAAAGRRKLIVRLSAVAAILLVILLSGLIYYISSDTGAPLVAEQIEKSSEKIQQQEGGIVLTITEEQIAPSINSEKAVANLVTDAPNDKSDKPETSQPRSTKQNIRENDVAPMFPKQTEETRTDVFKEPESIKNNTEAGNSTVTTEQPYLAESFDKNAQDSINAIREKELQNLLDLYNAQQDETLVAGLPSEKNSGKWGLSASFGSATSSSSAIHQSMPANTLSVDRVFLATKASNSVTDIDYAPPFSVGLTASKQLNKTFAIETGLVYSYLSTSYKDLDNKSYSTNVKLHYLGIPVNVLINIWNINSRFRVYASAGAMLEKGLRLNFSQENIMEQQTVTERRNISGVQWSLNGSVGASYAFFDNWNVYLEPQLSYFFDNNQPISIRTEKDVIFSLNTGVRFLF